MDINKLGESGLIRRLTEGVAASQPSTVKGIGDDAAILRYGGATLAVTTDTLVEGIHFDLTYTPLQHLGYKAAIVGFSDLYAMNATPRQLLASIAVSAKFSVEALERLYEGLTLACERYGVDLVGGDTKPSMTGLVITVTAIGEAEPSTITYRGTAQQGDLICLSGSVGAAYMGLQTLEREKKLFLEDRTLQPNLENYGYVVGRLLKPEARRDVIDFLAEAKVQPTAMIDVTDGLSNDLLHICDASGVGCEIHHHKIPIAEETVAAAEEFYLEPIIAALNGGDDHELLFTVPVSQYEKILGNTDISIIGYITEVEKGRYLVTENGTKMELKQF